uniref:Uncharacterized protein n=1 Tax=Arundo donax TaxID=35708 RepID=A0A0A9BNS1_ARUDO
MLLNRNIAPVFRDGRRWIGAVRTKDGGKVSSPPPTSVTSTKCGLRPPAARNVCFRVAAIAAAILDRDPPLPRPPVPCSHPLPAAAVAGTRPEGVAACGDPSDQKSTWIDSRPGAATGKELMGCHGAAIVRCQSEARCSRKESMRW